MDTAILVKSEREAGWDLLAKLKTEDFPMSAAYWQYLSDDETWRLFIATRLFDDLGPIAAYSRLQDLLNGMSDDITENFSVTNISLISPTSVQMSNLRRRYGRMEFDPRHLRRISLSYEEAYLYFLE